jgi:hypothetical protein
MTTTGSVGRRNFTVQDHWINRNGRLVKVCMGAEFENKKKRRGYLTSGSGDHRPALIRTQVKPGVSNGQRRLTCKALLVPRLAIPNKCMAEAST